MVNCKTSFVSLQGGTLLWARPSTMAGGLAAAYLAEALLNAPQILGSLDLLLNPTGLLCSLPSQRSEIICNSACNSTCKVFVMHATHGQIDFV